MTRWQKIWLIVIVVGVSVALVGISLRASRSRGFGVIEEPALRGSTAYARHFSIDTLPGFLLLTVHNAWNGHESSLRWILLDSTRACRGCVIPDSLRALPRVRIPLQRVALLSTTQLALFERLGALDRIVAVGTRHHIYSPAMHQRIDSLALPAVGNGSSLDVEQLLMLAPDAVFTFGTGSTQHDDYPRLTRARLPTLLTAEWMENHPLGRLEWIRLLGVLLHLETQADSLFENSLHHYDSLCALIPDTLPRPVVITGYPEADNWNTGGGQSYVAQLIHDAGGQFLWKESTQPGFVQYPLEKALTDGLQASIWLHPKNWYSYSEVIQAEPRVHILPAVQHNKIFQHSHRLGENGSIDYYESGIAYPERILADLIQLFHPSLSQDSGLYYYEHLDTSLP